MPCPYPGGNAVDFRVLMRQSLVLDRPAAAGPPRRADAGAAGHRENGKPREHAIIAGTACPYPAGIAALFRVLMRQSVVLDRPADAALTGRIRRLAESLGAARRKSTATSVAVRALRVHERAINPFPQIRRRAIRRRQVQRAAALRRRSAAAGRVLRRAVRRCCTSRPPGRCRRSAGRRRRRWCAGAR
jgi:hypothetical protein